MEHRPFLWTSSDNSVTGGFWSKGLSGAVAGVRRTPRLVVKATLIREVRVCADGEEGNSSSGSGGEPRLVVLLFLCLLVLEETKFEGNGVDSGDQMKVPSVVARTSK